MFGLIEHIYFLSHFSHAFTFIWLHSASKDWARGLPHVLLCSKSKLKKVYGTGRWDKIEGRVEDNLSILQTYDHKRHAFSYLHLTSHSQYYWNFFSVNVYTTQKKQNCESLLQKDFYFCVSQRQLFPVWIDVTN